MLSTRVAVRLRFGLGLLLVGASALGLALAPSRGDREPPDPPPRSCSYQRAPAPVEVSSNDGESPVRPEMEDRALEDRESPRSVCSCAITADRGKTVEEKRTLELACRLYSDESCRHEFEVFDVVKLGGRSLTSRSPLATATHPDLGDAPRLAGREVVIVKRSTGDCGGCGALVVAAVFDHGSLEAIGELGKFGRMGNGPDAVRFVEVAGEAALEVTSSTSMGGYTDEVREYFLREGDGFRNALCIATAADDRGAHEDAYEWKATLRHRADGAVEIRYRALDRSDRMPNLTPQTIGFDKASRRFVHDRSDDRCVVPFNPHLIDI